MPSLPGSFKQDLLTDSSIFASDMPDHYRCHDYRYYVHKVRSWSISSSQFSSLDMLLRDTALGTTHKVGISECQQHRHSCYNMKARCPGWTQLEDI